MAQNGWLPGTVKFDEKRFEKKPESLRVREERRDDLEKLKEQLR